MSSDMLRLFRKFKRLFYLFRYRLKFVHSTTLVSGGSVISRDLIAGKHSYVGPNAYLCPKVKLGKYVMLGPTVYITGKDHKYDVLGTPMIFSDREVLPETAIGDDVWIGANTIILAGVTIGSGSIIGAGSILTKNVPCCAVYAGNPAKKIKDRFDSKTDADLHLKKINSGDFLIHYAEKMN
jgi:acetyltransferase-like isoleucine patch superfamily enzyme